MTYHLTNLDGTTTKIDLRPSKYPLRNKEDCKSKAQYRFGQRLRELFPYSIILEEFGIPNSGKLSLDFWLPEEGFAFEIQGAQHLKFSRFHHGDIMGFKRQKLRDQKKINWCEINNIILVSINDTDVDKVDIGSLLNGSG